MGRPLTNEVLRLFPKVELHRHLEGAFPLDKLFELAIKNGVAETDNFEEFRKANQFPKNGEPDFLLFLGKFRNHWYQSLKDVEFITYHSVRHLKNDGIFYVELRFSPEHFASVNDLDRVSVIQTVIRAGNKAAREIGITINYLITLNRGKHSPEELLALYEAFKSASPYIGGFDLAGDESNYPPELFHKVFEKIQADGLFPTTIHAGEVSPPSQIWEAITNLHASRIGHGTSAVEDPQLQEYLIQNKVTLEQCLTSNYQTGSWRDTRTHPFAFLFRRGVPVTLNSDDPSIQDADLTDDYVLAANHFQFTIDDFIKANLLSLDAAFVTPGKKRYLKRKYLQTVWEFRARYSV